LSSAFSSSRPWRPHSARGAALRATPADS
jgi:hypothetical protein